MKRILQIGALSVVFAVIIFTADSLYGRVVPQQQPATEQKNIELVKKGEFIPNLTIFYLGEVGGWITPCG